MQKRLSGPRPESQRSYILWQEFIPDNQRDFRVTIIGRRYAFVFWRNNRPGDFRASGSGLIDYDVADGRGPRRGNPGRGPRVPCGTLAPCVPYAFCLAGRADQYRPRSHREVGIGAASPPV